MIPVGFLGVWKMSEFKFTSEQKRELRKSYEGVCTFRHEGYVIAVGRNFDGTYYCGFSKCSFRSLPAVERAVNEWVFGSKVK